VGIFRSDGNALAGTSTVNSAIVKRDEVANAGDPYSTHRNVRAGQIYPITHSHPKW
jgi:hypothetical protein